MITSLIEMLELPKFGHMTPSTNNFLDDLMDKNYDVIIFILKYLYFKKPRIVIFDDIKIVTMFIKTS